MKKLLLLFLAFFLCACASVEAESLPGELDRIFFHDADDSEYVLNNKAGYFSYYLPSDMQEKEGDDVYVFLTRGDAEILLNVNVGGIISSEYSGKSLRDDGFYDGKDLFYARTGRCHGIDGSAFVYTYRLYQVEDRF